MKKQLFKSIFVFLCLLLSSNIRAGETQMNSDPYLIYSIGSSKFSVAYLYESKEQEKEAAEKAIEKAKQVACEHGFPYLKILSEEKVVVLLAPSRPPSQDWYDDQYYDSLMKENFGEDPVKKYSDELPQSYWGYKIVIRGLKEVEGLDVVRACPIEHK